jgi:endoglucanase
MTDDRSIELLRQLSLAAGPPGAEDEVRAIVRGLLGPVGTLTYDRLGSILCELPGSADTPRILLDSHLDEVGFMVQSVADNGGLAFVPLGGWWGHVLLGQRVEVLARDGRVPGVIGSKPPHFLSAEERERVMRPESMYVDVGASGRGDVDALGIRVGDAIVPSAEFRPLAVPGIVSGKAFDDRIGVGLMCEALRQLADREHPNTVIGVGAVQEELGARGAGTATELARPDVALILECTPADDLPRDKAPQAALGRGPQIRHFDPTAVSNRRLVQLVERVAAKAKIDIQMAVRRTGGTDAGRIHTSRIGVPTVVIGVPARYIHSHVSVMQIADYHAALRLVVELVVRLDADETRTFSSFD